ncbi:OmpA family protein [Hyphomicrobium sp. CS1BSMeth3]|uniref:OmpA family protein n=1 Tax=Hyphomicrobium sp. CS1BSMeth3 TaxID=1892844 RepID=UPI000931A4AE|nr:OmpA family protein [Hyphomicrobium sp. CS1BSMeth3]
MSQDGVIRLKELLFDKESRELNALTRRLEEVAERAGTDARFRQSVAATLEGALRDAETANHRQVSDALAPLVVRTVRTEIETNSETLPAKLYPHIGVMVRDYVRSAIRDLMEDINRRLEDGLTKNRLSLRLRSWTTGRPMAELALADSGRFEVEELHLIQRGSGELLAHWSRSAPESAANGPPDGRGALFSGMLTAMTAFIEEVYEADKAGLRTIDFGGHTIYLRGSPHHLLAARCRGEAGAGVQTLLDEEFLHTLEKRGVTLDLADLAARLEAGIATRQESLRKAQRRSGLRPLRALLWLIGLALAAYFAWQAYISHQTNSLQAAVDAVIADTPALKGYPTRAHVARGGARIDVSGLAPSGDIRTQILGKLRDVAPAATISETIGIVPGAESAGLADEAARTRERLSALETRLETIAATLGDMTKSIDGMSASVGSMARSATVASELQDLRKEIAGLTTSLGSMAKSAAVATELQSLRKEIAALAPKPDPQADLERWMQRHAIFFADGTAYQAQGDVDAALDSLAGLMRRTDTAIRIVGYTDERGTAERNLPLALARADRVAADLARRGVDAARIKTVGRTSALDISQRSGSSSPNRRVVFEPAFVGEGQ